MVPLLLEHPKVNNQEFLSLFANLVRFGPFEFYILVIICNIFSKCCPIETQKAGNLKRHMRNVHEGRKDFECNMCNKKFKQLQSLKGTVQKYYWYSMYPRTVNLFDL